MANSGTRAGDADRNTVVDALATAFSEGQITQPEYDERSRAALEAATLAELGGLTGDLQSSPELHGEPDAATLPPTHTRTRGIAVGPWMVRLLSVALLAGVVFFGIKVWGSITNDDDAEAANSTDTPPDDGDGSGSDDAQTIPPIVIPSNPDVLTVDGFTRILDQMDAEIGSTTVTSLNLQEHTASFEMVRSDAPGTYSYYYDGFIGEPSHNDAGTPSGRRVDLTNIDVPAVIKLLDGLPARFDIDNATSQFIGLETDGYWSRKPALDLYLSGPTQTGYLIVGLDGAVIHEQPPS